MLDLLSSSEAFETCASASCEGGSGVGAGEDENRKEKNPDVTDVATGFKLFTASAIVLVFGAPVAQTQSVTSASMYMALQTAQSDYLMIKGYT